MIRIHICQNALTAISVTSLYLISGSLVADIPCQEEPRQIVEMISEPPEIIEVSTPCDETAGPELQDIPPYRAVLYFDEAFKEVLEHACELKMALSGLSAKEGGRIQAALYPNPELTVGIDSVGNLNDNDDANNLFVGVTQLVELGGKRPARMRVAEAEKYSSEWDIEIAKGDLYSKLLNAFIEVAAAQERVEIAKGQELVAGQTLTCVSSKKAAGKSSALEAKKAEIACKSAKLLLSREQANLSQAKKRMAAIWDCHSPEFEKVGFPLFELKPLPSLEELYDALMDNPTIAKAHAEKTKAFEVYRLERANRFPDLSVQIGVGTERFSHEPEVGFEIGIDIPIFDRNQGNIYRASYEHCQSAYSHMNIACELKKTLLVVYDQWLAAYDQAIEIRDNILPVAEESYTLAEVSYREGKFDYLDLLDARGTLFNIKQQYLQAVEDYHHKRADALKLTAAYKNY